MPPVSRRQQKLIFARARAGVGWAKKYIAEAGSMKVHAKHQKKRKKRGRRRGH